MPLVIIGLWILAVVGGPLLGIWTLNTLFGLGITYSFWTWLASLLFFGAIQNTSANRR